MTPWDGYSASAGWLGSRSAGYARRKANPSARCRSGCKALSRRPGARPGVRRAGDPRRRDESHRRPRAGAAARKWMALKFDYESVVCVSI